VRRVTDVRESCRTKRRGAIYGRRRRADRSIPYDLTDRQDEQLRQTIVWTVLNGVGIYCGGEIWTADGRINMVIETETRVFILEFKLDDTAADVINQIKENA